MAIRNIKLTINQIETLTSNAYLLKVPSKMYGPKFHFWVNKKFVRFTGKKRWFLSVGLVEDWSYRIFKNGQGRYNFKEVIREYEVSGKEFVKKFNSKNVA